MKNQMLINSQPSGTPVMTEEFEKNVLPQLMADYRKRLIKEHETRLAEQRRLEFKRVQSAEYSELLGPLEDYFQLYTYLEGLDQECAEELLARDDLTDTQRDTIQTFSNLWELTRDWEDTVLAHHRRDQEEQMND